MYKFRSHAKLNLFLHVVNKLKSGYHELDSLICFCEDIYDEIMISFNTSQSVNKVHFKNIKDSVDANKNSIIDIIKNLNIAPNADFIVHKNIPIGAGMGGGSANAAAIARWAADKGILSKDLDVTLSLQKTGADVPVCYYNKSAYFNGIGEQIYPVKFAFDFYAIVIWPNITINTSSIFKSGFKQYKKALNNKYRFNQYEELVTYLKKTENDLFENCQNIAPQIIDYIRLLETQKGCDISRMTGSGSAIFGLFKTKNDAINALMKIQKNVNCFVKITRLF